MLECTTEGAWEFIPGETTSSVHLSDGVPGPLERAEEERRTWDWLFATRERMLPELEAARRAKLIGKALEAKVTLTLPEPRPVLASGWEETLRELLNVSQLHLQAAASGAADGMSVAIARADGTKCERCWHWETDVGTHAAHPTLCGRCVGAVG